MADLNDTTHTIKLLRGTASALTTNNNAYYGQGVPFYATDTREFYIHDGTEFVKVTGLTIVPNDDSTQDLGSSSKYYANVYADKVHLNSTASIDGSSAGEITIDGTLIADKLMQIDAPTGNPEFNFKENGTTRGKVYYDIGNDRIAFQNNQNNNEDAIFFADSLSTNSNININGQLRVATHTPSSASDTGTAGTIAWDSDYIYICVSNDSWKRVSIASW